MKQFFISLFLGLVLVACNTSKTAVSPKASTSSSDWEPTENSLLWKVSKEGYQPSYIFGTIHIINSGDYFLPDQTLESIEESQAMVFEIDMADMTDMSTAMGIMTKAMMSEGTTLEDLLSEEEYKIVDDHFKDLGLPMLILNRIKPMFLSILAGEDMNPMSLNDGSMKSYEMELNTIAKHHELATGGLESIDYQLGLFDKIPYKDQAQMLLEAITENAGGSSDMMAKLTTLYKSQNIKEMHDLTASAEGGLDEYTDILLYERNQNWIPLIEQRMKTEKTFFAVGAGHLGGPKGVLALIKKQGFTVQAVR